MTAGTNLTALMKGTSSLTAQLEIETVLAESHVQTGKLRHQATYRCISPMLTGSRSRIVPK